MKIKFPYDGDPRYWGEAGDFFFLNGGGTMIHNNKGHPPKYKVIDGYSYCLCEDCEKKEQDISCK